MPIQQPFKSSGQASVALTTSAAEVAIPGQGENVLIYNATAVAVACDFQAQAGGAATAASPYVVPAGGRMIVTIGQVAGVPLYGLAFPLGTAAASVYFMRGDGSTY